MNVKVLNCLVRDCGKSKVQLAKQCGITRVTLDNALQGGDIRVSIVEALAKTLNIKVGVLFDDNADDNSSVRTEGDYSPASVHGNVRVQTGGAASEKVRYLEQIIAEKDKVIAEKERLIQVLMSK